jgi:hypothetical protein
MPEDRVERHPANVVAMFSRYPAMDGRLRSAIARAIADLACSLTAPITVHANGSVLCLQHHNQTDTYAILIPLTATDREIKSAILKTIPDIETIKRLDPRDAASPDAIQKLKSLTGSSEDIE